MQTLPQRYLQAKIADLTPHPRNPNLGDVGAIHTSIEANGWYGAIIVQKSSQHILAGNHRVLAAGQAGAAKVPILEVDCDDETALRILLADNRIAALAHNDEIALSALLTELATRNDLPGTGYDGDDVDDLLKRLANDTPGGDDRGGALEVLDVSIDEPKHKVSNQEVWRLGEQHILVCADVNHDWPVYMPHLTPGVVFAPYPTPLVPLTYLDGPLLLVQPSPYLAGHLVDKYASKHGEESVTRIEAAA